MLIHEGWDPSIVTKLHELHHLTPNFVHHHHLTSPPKTTFPLVVSNQHRIAIYIFPMFFFDFQRKSTKSSKNHWKISTLPPGLSRLNGPHPSCHALVDPRPSDAKRLEASTAIPTGWGPGCYMDGNPKIGVGTNPQKWMVKKNGKPYFLMDDLGGKPTIFGNIHIFSY